MTINIQTEYISSPVNPLWSMIDKLESGRIVFVRGKYYDLYSIRQNTFLLPLKKRLLFEDRCDFERIPLPDGKVVFKSEQKIRNFYGVVVFDYGIDTSKIWREIADINRSNVYVFLERCESIDIPVVSIR